MLALLCRLSVKDVHPGWTSIEAAMNGSRPNEERLMKRVLKWIAGIIGAIVCYFAVIIGSFLLMTRAAVESFRWR